MSKVSITGDNSGTGTFTIAAPDSNNNRSFSLPDEDGVVVTDSTDLEPQVKTSLNATGDAPMFTCRAFCNFDGTGTVSIRESGNVSSITDNGTGNYTVNFTTAMPDSNYSAVVGHGLNAVNNDTGNTAPSRTTTSCDVNHFESETRRDIDTLDLVIFR